MEYNFLIENYRSSDEAMSTLLYLTEYFDRQGRPQEAQRWFQQAERYFEEMAAIGAGTIVEAKALRFKADLYQQKNEWGKAAEILLGLFDKYPHAEIGRQALLKASAMYRQKLNDRAAADSLIEVLKAVIVQVEPGWES